MLLRHHSCTLKSDPKNSLTANGESRLRGLFLAWAQHPRSQRYYQSVPALVADRRRQCSSTSHKNVHPLSVFSFTWSGLMLLEYLAMLAVTPLRLCFVVNDIEKPLPHVLDYVLLVLQLISAVDLMVEFNTGLLVQDTLDIVMDRRHPDSSVRSFIQRHLVHLVAALPAGFLVVWLRVGSGDAQLLAHALPLVKILNVGAIIDKWCLILEAIFDSYIWRRVLRHLLLFVLIVHWFTCSMYLATMVRYYRTGVEYIDYNTYLKLNDQPLSKVSMDVRYKRALFVCMATFLGTGFSMMRVGRPDEVAVWVACILGSNVFMIYTVVLLLELYMIHCNSSTTYYEMVDQVESYMRNKQFPATLQKRILQFYDYRFQGHYFRESSVFSELSDHLRQEVILHTCRKLVDTVPIFKGLPKSLLGTILGCLEPEVYLPNDLIIRAGDTGECMYFIANGTVAIISLKGVEVCHLEDGAHFGEVALLVKDMKQIATAVAVEITEVYKMSRSDFRKYILSYSELYDRIDGIATARINETLLLDEAHRKERPVKRTSDGEPSAHE